MKSVKRSAEVSVRDCADAQKSDVKTSAKSGAGAKRRSDHNRIYKLSLCAILTAIAMIFSYIEAILPFNFGIPGIKLGLSNIVVMIAIYTIGASYAFAVNMTRILLSGLLFGGVSAMLYSLAGGLLSFAVMILLKKTGLFSQIGVSMAGGTAHNIGQLTVAVLVTSTVKIYYYMPVLLVSGMITGIILGIASSLLTDRMKGLIR